MKALRRFWDFWWDFIVGDDWHIAVGIVLALGLTAGLAHAGVTAWWVMPLAVAGILAESVYRGARRTRRG
jgi:hypothetical protein